jgi:hypothetical protein
MANWKTNWKKGNSKKNGEYNKATETRLLERKNVES